MWRGERRSAHSLQKPFAMAERGLVFITQINAAGLSLAQQAAVQRKSRITPLFNPA